MTTNKFAPYTVHPVADLFPLLAEAEMDALVQDIKDNGLIHPILIHGRKLIEGRNRFLACKKAEVEPRFKEMRGEPTELQIVKRIVSSNLIRRHLTVGQKSMLGVDLIPHLQPAAEERMREGRERGRQNRLSGLTPIGVRPDERSTTGRVNQQVAAIVDTGHTNIARAAAVAEHSAVLARQVRQGQIELNTAYRQTRPERERTPNRASDMNWSQSLSEFLGGIIKIKRGVRGLRAQEWTPERRTKIRGSIRELKTMIDELEHTAGTRPNLRAI